ncbi:maleylacetoacetate isomerase [Pacificimonas flava]|uniref:Maleylacetoacetate isomerase n=2 Tax=Pacificimonas TaxID=1960290 RepID=A0A219B5S0_9SPHN|nr:MULTISPECIES: maleylacetoacetate isomerase [Pacificimonas]MBZ6379330.1 maleylacetoacetate isomerase [Pacificimonas aurantium]OWV33466.1 maleylacetoacetate isomerase [Pacificimonas flava]
MSDRVLYDFWRSSAAFRVRIALGLKGLDYDRAVIDLNAGAQRSPGYRMLNPQGRVPLLIDGEAALNQSLAILEYLEEVYPDPPLLHGDAAMRGRIRGAAQIIVSDVHPLGNSSVMRYLEERLGHDRDEFIAWYGHWMSVGFGPLEELAERSSGRFLFGDDVTLADVCLAPQMYNARRWRTDLEPFPALVEVDKNLMELSAFRNARPEAQSDASA